MKLAASATMPAMVSGAVPVLRPTPGVVEQDDLAPRCQRVADGGVEVVEVAHEVLGEDQRGAGRGPEATVGKRVPPTSRNWVGAVVAREAIMSGLVLEVKAPPRVPGR